MVEPSPVAAARPAASMASMTPAETAYLFRHAVLREAAYQLQPPEERQQLHGLALAAFEAVVDGELAEAHSGEIADHAQLAGPVLAAREDHWRRVAAKRARAHYLHREAEHHLRRRIALSTTARERLDALLELSIVFDTASRFREGLELSRECVDVAADTGEAGLIADAAKRLAWFMGHLGSAADALAMIEPHIGVMRASGDDERLAGLLSDSGGYCRTLGDLDRTEEHYREALELSAKLNTERGRAVVLINLSAIYINRHQGEKAVGMLREALALVRKIDDQPNVAVCLGSLGSALQRIDAAESRACYQEALAVARRVGSLSLQSSPLGGLAILAQYAGDDAESERLRYEALRIDRELGDRRSASMQLGNLGDLYHGMGKLTEAEDCLAEALELARQVGSPHMEGYWLATLALVQYDRAEYEAAAGSFSAALPIARRIRDNRLTGAATGGLALLAKRDGRMEDANQLWQETEALLVGARMSGDLSDLQSRWDAA